MASKIRKTVFTLTVLHPADDNPAQYDLEDVLREIDSGLWIGSVARTATTDVPDKNIHGELLDIGNDGSFFDDYLADDEGEV